MIKDRETKQLKNYCYVEFTDEEAVDLIESQGDIKFIVNGKQVEVKRSQSNTKEREKINHVIHITNLQFRVKDEDLLKFFVKNEIPASNILEIAIIRDEKTGESKGFGFVEFNNEVMLY
jgi:RNA recognition motif-containing protein